MSPELTIDLFVLFQICETLFKVQHCLHKFGKFKPQIGVNWAILSKYGFCWRIVE